MRFVSEDDTDKFIFPIIHEKAINRSLFLGYCLYLICLVACVHNDRWHLSNHIPWYSLYLSSVLSIYSWFSLSLYYHWTKNIQVDRTHQYSMSQKEEEVNDFLICHFVFFHLFRTKTSYSDRQLIKYISTGNMVKWHRHNLLTQSSNFKMIFSNRLKMIVSFLSLTFFLILSLLLIT